ncbi:MAG: anaerobic ribonucleoside-triphosphate reductase activating protein [Oscillospiraceae bacterium]|jgi:anaerobic ribonucleoside-triphosphate reductase activating protein|nr:anaerobic ribonucleoside-triphosphate reductase activating protein [Oscillospiraceae bacterium]
MQIKLAGLVPESIVDGTGYRFAIFAQGCPHKCAGCHNPHTHDFAGGQIYDTADIVKQVKALPLIDGVTFTGGEPFCQPEAFFEIAENLAEYNIWCFTGYGFEELHSNENPAVHALLKKIDVLIDGRFFEEQASYELKFKGSKNQRFISCKESLKRGEVVLVEKM